MEVELMFADL